MYFRFGNTAGAYASLIVGTVVSDGGNPYAAELGRFHLSMARTGGMAGKHRCRSGDGFGTFSALYRLADGCFCMALLFAAPSVRNSGSLFFGGNSVNVLFRSFSMRRNGSTHRLDCIDGVSHVFGGGGFEKCELRNQGRGGTSASRLRKSSNGTAADQLTGSRAKWESSDSDSSSFEKRKMRLIT